MATTLTPQERYMMALRGEQPDEVPVSLSIGPSNAKRWLGKDDWKTVLEAHKIVGSIPAQDYGLDFFTTDADSKFRVNWNEGWGEIIETQVVPGPRHSTIRTKIITTPFGTLKSQEKLDQGEYIHGQTLEPLIKSQEDYEIYLAYLEEWLRSVETVRSPEMIGDIEKAVGSDGIWVTWNILTFYQYFWVLRRVEDYLLDFYDAPELMKRVLKITQKLNERFLQEFNQSSSPLLICNLSGASTSIISPAFFREWILPELKWMVANANPDKFIGFHLTGKVRELMPIMLEAKPDTILRFESPRFGGDIALSEVKEKYGDKICIMGGYDPHIFTLGGREEIRQETIRCIDEAAKGGGYILANTDVIPEDADIDDVKYMVDVAKQYGKYA